uniref:Secreted protein n=1 Tax=Glossina palpalis gambiensis TaxID=67801 RepID=A0A1B0BHQ0_9MUSC
MNAVLLFFALLMTDGARRHEVIVKLLPATCITILHSPKSCITHTPPVIVHESLLLINPTYDISILLDS